MTTIDIAELFSDFSKTLTGNQKRIDVQSSVAVYYGISSDGFLRLSFMSTIPAPKIESTKMLKITQGRECEGVYWTCFDLLKKEAESVYYSFCTNLIASVEKIEDEAKALSQLKRCYITWKTMFKKESSTYVSNEEVQGLFGELYFLKNYLMQKYDLSSAILAWSGPDAKSKDFSIEDSWYEIKTVGANSTSVRISSLAQLSSKNDGHLVVLRAEAMSDKFSNGESSIGELFTFILSLIDDESIEGIFLSKLSNFGFDITNERYNAKYDIKSVSLFAVSKDFPRITEDDIAFAEISDVSYSLNINALQKFLEE